MNDKQNPFDEETAKEMFTRLYKENIKRAGSEELFAWLEKTDFFAAPASTKYHGAYDGGLCEHSVHVFMALKNIISTDEDVENAYSNESIAIVSLLHDLCKVQYYKKGFRNVKDNDTGKWNSVSIFEVDEKFPYGHGEKSVLLIQAFMKLSIEELLACRFHMGGFDKAVVGGDFSISKAYEMCKLAPILHMADLWATYIMEAKAE